MTLFERLRAQQKADKAKAETRAQKRREYARAARERDRLRRLAAGLGSLPVVTGEPAKPETTPEPARLDPSAEELVTRLEAIKQRILRLHSMFAMTLAFECAQAKQPEALESLVRGHEAILLSPPVPVRQQIPIETQKFCELQWEVMRSPISHSAETCNGTDPGWSRLHVVKHD